MSQEQQQQQAEREERLTQHIKDTRVTGQMKKVQDLDIGTPFRTTENMMPLVVVVDGEAEGPYGNIPCVEASGTRHLLTPWKQVMV